MPKASIQHAQVDVLQLTPKIYKLKCVSGFLAYALALSILICLRHD